MITNYTRTQIPMNLSSALSKNPEALNYFKTLDRASQNQIINHSESMRSKEELDRFISSMNKGASIR